MIPLMIRGLIIYVVIISSVRLMGKRQIGELQPSELVITILLSQIASMPLEDNETSLVKCVVAIFLLVSLEIIASVLAMKSRKFRMILQGNSVLVIKDGKIVQKNMRLIRFSVDDLIEALRLKDVFDISTVDYAYIETNGAMSVLLKGENEPVTFSAIGMEKEKEAVPCLVISDGKIVRREFDVCNLTDEKLFGVLRKNNINEKDVLLMTYSADGKTNIIPKEKNL